MRSFAPAVPRARAVQPPSVAARRVQVHGHVMDPSVNIDDFRRHPTDVGSTEVQVAQISARVRHLTEHLRANKRDFACRRGLSVLLGHRKNLLKYLYAQDKQQFARVVRELKIRNPIKGIVMERGNTDDEGPEGEPQRVQAAPQPPAQQAPPAAAASGDAPPVA